MATENQKKNEAVYIEHTNLKSVDKEFEIGDLVLVLILDGGFKLKAKWLGPGTIQSRVSKYSYLIRMPDNSVCLLHANKLRYYHSQSRI